MVKRILGVSLATVMALSSAVPAFAVTPANGQLTATDIYADSTGSVVADKDAVDINGVVGKDTTQGKYSQYDVILDGDNSTTIDPFTSDTEVYATVLPAFTARIPKVLVLSAAGECEFAVSVKGDISGAQTVLIKPEAEQFDMVEVDPLTGNPIGKKDNVPATISVDDIDWTYATDFKAVDAATYVDHTGSILADGLTAGSWRGIFNFLIGLNSLGNGNGNTPDTPEEEVITYYTPEEIEADSTMFMIGATRPEYVVANYNEDFTEVIVTKNGDDSDGIMMAFGNAETEEPYTMITYNYVDTLEKVTIENGVTNIGEGAFAMHYNLKDVNIAGSVKTIDPGAFLKSGLTEIEIPYGTINIGYKAFYWCEDLKKAIVSDSVISIGDEAFQMPNATTGLGVSELKLGNNLKTIGYSAFFNNSSLSELVIPDSVEIIEDDAFMSCHIDNITLGKGLKVIGMHAFMGNDIETIVIPDSVETIEKWAFQQCEELTSVTIGKNVKTIENGAFYGCKNLTSIRCKTQEVADLFNENANYNADNTTIIVDPSVLI